MNTTESSNTINELELYQTLRGKEPNNSVTCLSVYDNRLLYAGTESGIISVWNLETFSIECELEGHSRSVLCLCSALTINRVFSGSGDDSIRAWDASNNKILFIISLSCNVGDVLSLAYSTKHNLLFFGCQNTSIQWFECVHENSYYSKNTMERSFSEPIKHLSFFKIDELNKNHFIHNIPYKNIYNNAHVGYIYSLMLCDINIDNVKKQMLVSGSGDGTIKIWNIEDKNVILHKTLEGQVNNIFCLDYDNEFLFSGNQDGYISVYDVGTFDRHRVLNNHKEEVLSLLVFNGFIFSASIDGSIKKWNSDYEFTSKTNAHNGMVLALAKTDCFIVSAGIDGTIKIWNMPPSLLNYSMSSINLNSNNIRSMTKSLEKFVEIKSISGDPKFISECTKGAKFIKDLFVKLGAESKFLYTPQNRNPVIYAKFKPVCKKHDRHNHILIYGHYDVVSAHSKEWDTDPFVLTGNNGYLYGRGASDNKGPIIAMIYAIKELIEEKILNVDITFLIEGEEESGSFGFQETIIKNKSLIGSPDVILLSNSYWMNDSIPCITNGLRGVVQMSIQISSKLDDSHSGVNGGVIKEPLIDLTHILSSIVTCTDQHINVPNFYEDVKQLSDEDKQRINTIVTTLKSEKVTEQKIISQWYHPSITFHKIRTSGPSHQSTVISSSAVADISIRLVPNQNIEKIVQEFCNYINELFEKTKSSNSISIKINKKSKWWLGCTKNDYFEFLVSSIKKEWNTQNILLIKEGGTIPAIPFLEEMFDRKILHFPMGHASDNAHLKNERIRMENLIKGKGIVKSFFTLVGNHNHQ